MSLVQQGHILAGILWLMILLGPPLLLSLLAPMMYLDGATQGLNRVPVKSDSRVTLLLLIISFTVWVLLLKFLYLPAIGFDSEFLSFNGAPHWDYTDLVTLRALGMMTLSWIGRTPAQAIALLAFVPLLGASVLLIARAQGRAAAVPPLPVTRWR